MRTRLVLCAALAATVLGACMSEQHVTAVQVVLPGNVVGDTTISVGGNCEVTIQVNSSVPAVNGTISGNVGTQIQFSGVATAIPPGCISTNGTWSSSNTSVVTIGTNGLATIVGAGTAQICYTLAADSSVRFCITVVGNGAGGCMVTGVTITGPTNPIAVGSTLTLAATVASNPANCATQGVTWSSSNPAVATVSASGVVTGVSLGTVTITATSVNDPSRSGTFTVTVNATTTPTVTIGALTGMSTGNGCAQTQPLLVTVSGVTNPVITVSSSNPGVATVAGSAGNWTVTRVAAGQVTFTASVTGSNLSSPITFTTPALTVGTADCTTPATVTFGPLVNMSNGTNCASTQPVTLNINGITNPVVTWNVTGGGSVTGSLGNWVYNRGSAGVGTVTLTASVTGSNQTQPVVATGTFQIGNTPCAGAGTFTFSRGSICFNAGSATSVPLTVTAADMPAGTVLTVSTSLPGVTVSPSTFTFPTGNLTVTFAGGTTLQTDDIVVTGNNGATGSIPVQIMTACPGNQTIDYTPGGGTIASGSTPPTLTAICTQGGATISCANQPFWTSDHPEILAVRGTTTTTVNGQTFYVGNTATLQRVSSGGGTTVQICVQWSLSQTSPRTCHGWLVP